MIAMKKSMFLALALTLCSLFPVAGQCASYPERTINIINPFLAGGWMDLTLRPLIEEMTKSMGVSVITTPTPGAGGSIGHMKVATAKADGYTLLLSIHNTLLSNSMLRDVRYAPETFVPLAAYATVSSGLAVKADDKRFSTMEEFVAYAKANPGKVSMGISGTRNTPAVAAALFEQKTGIKLNWVPFNGAAAVSAAVASGHVDCGVMQTLSTPGIRPLLLFGQGMSEIFPNIPTAKGKGIDIDWTDYEVIYAPAGLEAGTRKMLEKAIMEAAASPSVQEALKRLNVGSGILTGEEVEKITETNKKLLQNLIDNGYVSPETKK